jgi:hypothetical protein
VAFDGDAVDEVTFDGDTLDELELVDFTVHVPNPI